MGSDLQSGDTSDASSLLSDLLSNAPNSSSNSSSSTAGSSSSTAEQITKYLKTLQGALSSGDTTSATTILGDLKDYLKQNTSYPISDSGTYSSDGTLASTSSSSVSTLSALI